MTIVKEITLNNRKIKYKVKRHRRAKRLKIAVSCGGDCRVTIPWRMGLWNAEKFMLEHSNWVLEKIKMMTEAGEKSIFAKQNEEEYEKLKKYAHGFVTEKIKKFQEFYGFSYNKITIRNQRTRWGSCSKNRNLNFNYKVALLPQKHAEYIIVHELCHLKEFNHSKKFWELVSRAVPDYLEILKDLKSFR